MAMTQNSHPDLGTDIWHQHEPLIRSLYLVQNNTLRNVKEMMESEHGFPEQP